jgi:hypothetical protein
VNKANKNASKREEKRTKCRDKSVCVYVRAGTITQVPEPGNITRPSTLNTAPPSCNIKGEERNITFSLFLVFSS